MSQSFDFEKVLKALQSGQVLTGKDGILKPLIKPLIDSKCVACVVYFFAFLFLCLHFTKVCVTYPQQTDNASMESIFHSLTVECIRGDRMSGREIMQTMVFDYIGCEYACWLCQYYVGRNSPG